MNGYTDFGDFVGYDVGQDCAVLQVPAYLYCGPLADPVHRLLLVLGPNRNHVLLRQKVKW